MCLGSGRLQVACFILFIPPRGFGEEWVGGKDPPPGVQNLLTFPWGFSVLVGFFLCFLLPPRCVDACGSRAHAASPALGVPGDGTKDEGWLRRVAAVWRVRRGVSDEPPRLAAPCAFLVFSCSLLRWPGARRFVPIACVQSNPLTSVESPRLFKRCAG